MNILIAEDDYAMLESLADLFTAAGYRVWIARNGEDALSLAASSDILVTDYRLPRLNGLELQRRACEANPALQVILMTGHGSAEIRDQALACGARAYFEKPFRPHLLLAVLRSIDQESVAQRRQQPSLESEASEGTEAERRRPATSMHV